jgi:HlyD family secretion protein
MTRRTKWIVGGAVALGAVVAVAAAVAANRGPKGTRVRTTTATRGDLVSLVTANGTLEAETKVDLSANIMGQIMQLNVEEGDRVRKGDLLLVIDQTRYGAAVDSRQAALQVLEAQLTRTREVAQQAARDRERAQRQYEQQILPLATYEQARSMADQAQAGLSAAERQINQARADLKAAQDELAKTEIRAPMDGVVTRRNIETGEVVVTGTMNNPGTVLMTISDMASIEAVLEVDQTDMPRVRLGQPARVLIDAFPDRPFAASVSEIGSSPIQGASALGGQATGTDYEVKARLAQAPEGVRPGLTVTADITTDRRAGVLKVPIGALVLRQAEEDEATKKGSEEEEGISTEEERLATVASRERDVEGVYVVEQLKPARKGQQTGKVVFRPVTAGARGELDIEIVSGLKEGDVVVTGPFKALRELKPGGDVVVDNSESAELDQ